MKFISIISALFIATGAFAQSTTPASKEAPKPEENKIVKTQPWTVSVRDLDHPLIPKNLRSNSLVLTNGKSFSASCDKNREVVEVFIGYGDFKIISTSDIYMGMAGEIETEEDGSKSNPELEQIRTFLTQTGDDLWSHSFNLDKNDERVSKFEDLLFGAKNDDGTYRIQSEEDIDDWREKARLFRTMCQLTSNTIIKEGYRTKNTTSGFFREMPGGLDHVNVIMSANLQPSPQIMATCERTYEKEGWNHLNKFQATYGIRRCYIQNMPERNLDPILRKLKFAMSICAGRPNKSGVEYTACIDPVFLK